MQDINALLVKTWTGEEKPVKKVLFFPETDQNGDLFYKIEGWDNNSCFMISYSHDKVKAWKEYIELLQRLTEFHVNNLMALS